MWASPVAVSPFRLLPLFRRTPSTFVTSFLLCFYHRPAKCICETDAQHTRPPYAFTDPSFFAVCSASSLSCPERLPLNRISHMNTIWDNLQRRQLSSRSMDRPSCVKRTKLERLLFHPPPVDPHTGACQDSRTTSSSAHHLTLTAHLRRRTRRLFEQACWDLWALVH